MADLTEDELYAMDDDALEAAFLEAKAAQNEEVNLDLDEVVAEYTDDHDATAGEEAEEEEFEEETTEDEEEELEQPDEDSDKTEDTQVNDKDGEEEDEDKGSEEDLDKDTTDTPENSTDAKAEESKISTYKVKAHGTELELTNEELIKLAPKALDYTKKMQEIAPHRKNISIMVDNEISAEDLNLLVSMKKGDVDAFSAMSKIAGVDTLGIDVENADKYVPKEYGRTEQQLGIDDVISNISADKEFEVTQRVIDSQWDSKSREYFTSKPEDIQVLHNDIKEGRYGDISARAMKLRVLDSGPTKSDVEYYIEAGHQYYAEREAEDKATKTAAEQASAKEAQLLAEQEAVKAAKAQEAKQAEVKKAAKSRKAAATTKKVAGKRNVIDYLDDNDEAYDEWYKKLQASI